MIKIYEHAAQFLDAEQSFLLEREAVSQLVLANAAGAGKRPCTPDCMFGTVLLAGAPVLAFCNCLPWNLVVYSIPVLPKGTDAPKQESAKDRIAEASKELAAFLKEKGIPVNGINANGTVCDSFLACYDRDGHIARRNLSMDIMECRTLKPVILREGIYRCAEKSDAEWILDACIAFEKEALGEDGDREKLRENIIEQIGEKRVRLFCIPDSGPVAMANRTRDLKTGFVINQVYTLPAYRGKGYAQTLIFRMCAEFFKEGYSFATLFVDQANPISNRVYEKVGFEIIEDHYDYRFDLCGR